MRKGKHGNVLSSFTELFVKAGSVTLVVLRDDDQHSVAQLAYEHAAFDGDRRRVLIDDGQFFSIVPPATVAITLRPDGSICALLDHDRALTEAWIEDGFICAARSL